MTDMNSLASDEHEASISDMPMVCRNGLETAPETHSAMANSGLLLRETQRVGYAAVAQAAGRSKPWITHFFNDQAQMNRPQLLAWMDATGIRFTTGEPTGDQALLETLQTAADGLRRLIEQSANDVPADPVTLSAAEFDALRQLALAGLNAMKTR